MKTKLLVASMLAAVLTAAEVNACNLYVTVICPNDTTAAGISVCATKTDGSSMTCGLTDATGLVHLVLPNPDTYIVCVDPSTLPVGATLGKNDLCQKSFVPDVGPGVSLEFVLEGPFCTPAPPPGLCWMTGGGNIGNGKTPLFSFGGVVYPGCSPLAADGGNWNVVDHSGLHFQGQIITVDDCFGPPTRSPRVTVRAIDFHGTGIITGTGGNPTPETAVNFVGEAIDNHDGGAGTDELYLLVTDASSGTILMQIGTGIPTAGVLPLAGITPDTISVGNIQIHQSSCGK